MRPQKLIAKKDEVARVTAGSETITSYRDSMRKLARIILDNQQRINECLTEAQGRSLTRETMRQYEGLLTLTSKSAGLLRAYPEVVRALIAMESVDESVAEQAENEGLTSSASEMAAILMKRLSATNENT